MGICEVSVHTFSQMYPNIWWTYSFILLFTISDASSFFHYCRESCCEHAIDTWLGVFLGGCLWGAWAGVESLSRKVPASSAFTVLSRGQAVSLPAVHDDSVPPHSCQPHVGSNFEMSWSYKSLSGLQTPGRPRQCLRHSLPGPRQRVALGRFHEGELGQMLSFLRAGSRPYSSSQCKSFTMLLTERGKGGRVQSGDWDNLAVGWISTLQGSGGRGKDVFTCALRLLTSLIEESSYPLSLIQGAPGHQALHCASSGSPSASSLGSVTQVHEVSPLMETGDRVVDGRPWRGDEGKGRKPPGPRLSSSI